VAEETISFMAELSLLAIELSTTPVAESDAKRSHSVLARADEVIE
jgi:hypothetical protein